MQKKLFFILILLILSLGWFVGKTFAGGGHFEMGPLTGYTYVNSPAEIRAVLHSPNDATQFSTGEHVTFVINSARSGDACSPSTAVADSNGNVSSLCTAQTQGQISVHIHSEDFGDDSPNVVMTFDPVPQQPTSAPTPTVTPLLYHIVIGNTPTPLPFSQTTAKRGANVPSIISPTSLITPSPTATPTAVPTKIPTPTYVQKQFIKGLSVQNISVYVAGLVAILAIVLGIFRFLQQNTLKHPREVITEKIEKQQEASTPIDK